jgi:hypothetical protein
LNHNLIEIKDGNGRVVLSNAYGTDPSNTSFDRVISQTLGDVGSADSSLTFEYHDLALEREFAQTGHIILGTKTVSTAPGPIDPSHVSSLHSFNPVDVCPATGLPFGWSDAKTIVGPAQEPQLPTFANVIHDLHGVTRTIYLDKDKRILRQVTFAKTGEPYETVDYNYRVQPNGLDRGMRLPAGNRLCMYVENTLDQNTLVAELPAPGLPGDTLPRITLQQ